MVMNQNFSITGISPFQTTPSGNESVLANYFTWFDERKLDLVIQPGWVLFFFGCQGFLVGFPTWAPACVPFPDSRHQGFRISFCFLTHRAVRTTRLGHRFLLLISLVVANYNRKSPQAKRHPTFRMGVLALCSIPMLRGVYLLRLATNPINRFHPALISNCQQCCSVRKTKLGIRQP